MYKCREIDCNNFKTNSKMELIEHSQIQHNREYSMEFLIGIKTRDIRLRERVYARAKPKQTNITLSIHNDLEDMK